jgi:hypothetical protein
MFLSVPSERHGTVSSLSCRVRDFIAELLLTMLLPPHLKHLNVAAGTTAKHRRAGLISLVDLEAAGQPRTGRTSPLASDEIP